MRLQFDDASAARHVDTAIAVLLFALGTTAALWASSLVDPTITAINKIDIWLDADTPRVFANMTDVSSNHYRTSVHPLFSFVGFVPTAFARVLFGLGPHEAVRVVDGLVAGVWIATLFIALRVAGVLRVDAVLFAVLAAVSGAAVFFATIPETYVFGALTILAMIIVVARSEQRPVSLGAYCMAVACTLSMTTTNLMVGAAAVIRELRLRRAVPVLLCAIAIVTLLWGPQKGLFPSAHFFLGDQEEGNYMTLPDVERLENVTKAFFLHSMIFPTVRVIEKPGGAGIPIMSVQDAPVLDGGVLRLAGVFAWVALIAIAVFSLIHARSKRKLIFLLVATVAGQFVLHLLYGDETVLYSLHYLPVLIMLVAIGSTIYWRALSRVLVLVAIVAAAVTNLAQFSIARTVLASAGNQRQLVQSQMRLRPDDPWPRGAGHVVVAYPGSAEADKSYVEPGGSFSPRVGSFGIQLWLATPDGRIVATGDSVELAKTRQKFTSFPTGAAPPGVVSSTPFYEIAWALDSLSDWTGRLAWKPSEPQSPVVAIRSVGPAGGPIYALHRQGDSVVVNGRWRIEMSPPPAAIRLGSEGRGKLSALYGSDTADDHDDVAGWGIAILQAANTGDAVIRVTDLSAVTMSANREVRFPPAMATDEPRLLEVDVPDARFVDSLRAQEAQLLMGLVGNETRPADPINYPLAWQRDAAYVLIALARTGHEATGQRLATQLQKVDFFGGFGAEADAPGLGLWALSELATLTDDERATRAQWPDIVRKARIIEEMLGAQKALHEQFVGTPVPAITKTPWSTLSLVADPARDGLIQGKMDFGRPVFYVNAVSYLGLVRAAQLATSIGEMRDAARWTLEAEKIKAAWIRSFGEAASRKDQATSAARKGSREESRRLARLTRDYANDRTWIGLLWPSGIGGDLHDQVERGLDARWKARRQADGGFRRRPPWTYFELAEAHQWLALGDRAKAWVTLEWFWKNQPAPGLYTLWEGTAEENSYRRWDDVRGWVDPPYTAPHFWSSAEMLLLQLDMLVSWRSEASAYTLLIGGGVPDEWREHRLSVRDAPIPGGRVSWRWDGAVLDVEIDSDRTFRVVAGPAFPRTAQVHVVGKAPGRSATR